MNSDGGYTRHFRRMWQNPAFRNKHEAGVFSWMIDAAQWREHRMATRFGPVTLGVGELLIAEREMAEDFGMHRNTFRALLQRMSDEGIIERFSDRAPHRAGTVVRIKNYAQYQGLTEQDQESRDRKRTAARAETGPDEDRSGTKNNQEKEVNYSLQSLADAGASDAGSDLLGDIPPKPKGTKRAKPAKPSPNGALFSDGAQKLSEMTGKAPDTFGGLLNNWKRLAGNDPVAVLGFIQEAHRRWLAEDTALQEPVAWIVGCVRSHAKRSTAVAALLPEWSGGYRVKDVVEECCRITGASCDEIWEGFDRFVADVLADDDDGGTRLYQVMWQAKRLVSDIQGVGWFRKRIAALRERSAA